LNPWKKKYEADGRKTAEIRADPARSNRKIRGDFKMLVNLNDVLIPAQKGKYAVGLFNTVNLEMARGVIAAAEETGSPVIIGTAEVLLPYGPLEELSYFLVPMAKKARVPVVVHFDHGLTEECCIQALNLGFSSIMYDCSTLGYEENIREVKKLADIAHAFGASIEAELGHVGDNEGSAESGADANPESLYTDPGEAGDFVRRTGADALAVAVGSAHGAYKLPPKLDFPRITKIAETVGIPLVLHGGSGLSDDDFRTAVEKGIAKINIFTDLNNAASEGILMKFTSTDKGITDLIPAEVEAVKNAAIKKMQLFGCTGRY
jgi:fructose-bisphosphate aldolase, class II